jgi:hypothetical protein
VGRLIDKRFITIVKGADIYHRKAAVYQVRGYAAAIAAQRREGKAWVLRTGTGVFFAHQLASTVEDSQPSTVEARTPSTVEVASTVTVEARSPSTVEVSSTTSLGIKNEGTSSSSAVVGEQLRRVLTIDDDAVAKIIASCQKAQPDATGEEIAYFAEIVIAKHRHNPKVDNLVGLMIRGAVARYFEPPASELIRYREEKKRDREKAEQFAREVLADPESTDADQEWARSVIAR